MKRSITVELVVREPVTETILQQPFDMGVDKGTKVVVNYRDGSVQIEEARTWSVKQRALVESWCVIGGLLIQREALTGPKEWTIHDVPVGTLIAYKRDRAVGMMSSDRMSGRDVAFWLQHKMDADAFIVVPTLLSEISS